MFRRRIQGPASLAVYNDSIYTGTLDGHVLRIRDSRIESLVQIRQGSSQCWNREWNNRRDWNRNWGLTSNRRREWDWAYNGKESNQFKYSRCGRPIGMRITSKGVLYFVEAFTGLYSIHLNELPVPKLRKLLSVDRIVNLEGKSAKYFDDLVVDEEEEVVYISDSSDRWDLNHWPYNFLEPDHSGKLFKYDLKSRRLTLERDLLWFPKGIELMDNKEAILISEFTTRRILKHYIKGRKKGITEVFNDNMPGQPEHIRRSGLREETYWVGIAMPRNATNRTFVDNFSDKPFVRWGVVKAMDWIGRAVKSVGRMIRSDSLTDYGQGLKYGSWLQGMLSNDYDYGLVVELNKKGKIIDSLHSKNGTVSGVSEVLELKVDIGSDKMQKGKERILYLASYQNAYLGKLFISKNRR